MMDIRFEITDVESKYGYYWVTAKSLEDDSIVIVMVAKRIFRALSLSQIEKAVRKECRKRQKEKEIKEKFVGKRLFE